MKKPALVSNSSFTQMVSDVPPRKVHLITEITIDHVTGDISMIELRPKSKKRSKK
jgi:hypothetical protein